MRVLYVHAHPDDETIATGLSIAALTAAGTDVHVLTCTLGEQGEVIPPELAHVDADHDDTLAEHRRGELHAALTVLGAHGHILGAEAGRPSRYRDSGMAGSPSSARPDAFVQARPAEAITLVRNVIDDISADVVVTYENQGGYAHPDHIQAHRLTCAAIATSATPPRLYAVITPAGWAREDRSWLTENVREPGVTVPAAGEPFPPSVVPDGFVAVVHESVEARARQRDALAAHATQARVFEGWFALSNNVAQRLSGREAWARLDPRTGLLVAGEDR